MAATEITACAALQERTLETWGAQRHEGTHTRYVAKESWIITGKTFALQSALFLPLAYAIGLKLDYGLPGMMGAYLLCMLALLLALAPRTINFLRNPSKPPHDCFFPFKPDYLPARTSSISGRNNENDGERLRLM